MNSETDKQAVAAWREPADERAAGERASRLAKASAIAADAAPRVRARRDYASGNIFAVIHRQDEIREIGIRVMAAEAARLADAAALGRRIVESVRVRSAAEVTR